MTLNDLLDWILPDVPGCPSAVTMQALRRTCIDFLTRSQLWDEVQEPFALEENVQDYYPLEALGARCIGIKAVYTNIGELEPVSMDRLAQVLPDWQTAQSGAPSWYTRAPSSDSFRVYPIPTNIGTGQTLCVRAINTLKDTATTVPEDIARRYIETIAHGTKARLMTMPKVAWQDLPLAAYHKGEYESGISAGRIEAQMSKTTGSARALPRRFGQ